MDHLESIIRTMDTRQTTERKPTNLNAELRIMPKMDLTKSSDGFETFFIQHKNLEAQVRILQEEVASMKRKVFLFEEETNRNRWNIRYSRNMAILSNLLLGLWIFWSRLLSHVQKQHKGKLLGFVMPHLRIGTQTGEYSLRKILTEGGVKAISKSWVFFAGAFLLTRTRSWKRHLGLALTTAYSLYLALFSRFLPWTNFFNMFANVLYITAGALTINHSGDTNESLTDYLDFHNK
ncbi:hypothetical protein PROFUN_08328 [Planoprotostelium fungivorum]|uniref:Uncharacterized protein n=1 Tax=Planoprotostelium fungivorum TaxID=1890364 RepID=A0A2P6NI40_9EUKA|nr:hypothetical protein PROFUN_08328 [Planoprotostelium fungivorum]